MKKIRYFIVMVIFFSLNSCDRLPFGSQSDENSFVGEWELIELTGGIGGNKWNFESPSPNTLKIQDLGADLSFIYSSSLNDGHSCNDTMIFTFSTDVSIFDNKRHLMLKEKHPMKDSNLSYFTILYEFRENENCLILDENVYDGFRSVYKRIR